MIGVDTNLLVYAHREDSDFYGAADLAIAGLAEGKSTWVIPWPCIHEFYSIVTHPKVYDPPSTAAQAIEQIDAWLASPSLRLVGETSHHWRRLRDVLVKAKIAGPKVHDARIAAICTAHGVTELWTADRDFSRFREVKIRNPLM